MSTLTSSFRWITLFLCLIGSGSVLNAAAPDINSPSSASAVVGQGFSYTITTVNDDAVIYGTSSLPQGLSRSGATISGIPEAAGVFEITLYATNGDGTGTGTLTLTVSNPVPAITSSASVETRVGSSFSYTITATNSPDNFVAIGLSAIGGLSLDTGTGVISGVPANDGNFDLLVSASNGAGSGSQIVNVVVRAAVTGASSPTVVITSPSSGVTFEGTTSQITITAEVTPEPGETVDTVFVRWTNPPANFDSPEVVVAVLQAGGTNPGSGAITYQGTAELGFNPNDRQIGGGSIDLKVVAFQANAVDSADYGSDDVSFIVKPIVELLFPSPDLAMDAISVGDVFASVRVSTNNPSVGAPAPVVARIAGASILDTVSSPLPADPDYPQNGVFNFEATARIDFPGTYSVRVAATDAEGNVTQIERSILISDSLAQPVALTSSPTPGFTNEVFTAALFAFTETTRSIITVNDVGVVGYRVTYALTLISEGQGYFPRNASDATIPATAAVGFPFSVPDVTVANGRVTELPGTFTRDFLFGLNDLGVPDPAIYEDLGSTGQAYLDALFDPGTNGKVQIAAEFFKANAGLESYKIFVNGENVTPGTGNLLVEDTNNNGVLDPGEDLNGDGILQSGVDVPALFYPANGAPAPGDYVIVAQVTDLQGEVGTSEPTSFSIVPFEPLEISLSRVGNSPVSQGDSATFEVVVNPVSLVDVVTFYDSDSKQTLGTAPQITIDGESVFRFTKEFLQQGSFGLYAEARGFNGQIARSSSLRISVQPVDDLEITITSPLADVQRFIGESVTVVAEATATAGIDSVVWIVNNEEVETDESEPYAYTRVFNETGIYRIRASATDNFGNTSGSSEAFTQDPTDPFGTILNGQDEIIVTVLPSDLIVSLTSPTTDQSIVAGESLSFTASASATLGVASVTWFVDGIEVEVDTNPPYTLTQSFPNAGQKAVFARAVDSLGNSRSTVVRNITVNTPNALLRDEDFLADVYSTLVGRSPTADERAEALAALDGTLAARSAYVADLLRSDKLETTVITLLIYRTMTSDWPDASELAEARDVLLNGGNTVTSADLLTTFLIPEYEARFAALNTDLGFIRQLFRNKHGGVAPTAQSEVRLFNSATGGDVQLSETITVPGYGGDLVSYATQFALDNDMSGLQGVSGLPLTSIHYYSIPNFPADNALIVAAISGLLGVEPTNAEVAALSSLSLEAAIAEILTDARYLDQFPSNTVESFVALEMANYGVFDISKNGPDDDADGDGSSNLEEIILGSDPNNAADTVAPLEASIDGSDFVVTFVRLKSSERPSGIALEIQCSPDMTSWTTSTEGMLTLAADQSDLDSRYERVEFRIDMTVQDCAYVRVVVN